MPATSKIDLALGYALMAFVIFGLMFQFYRVRRFLPERWPIQSNLDSIPSLPTPTWPLKCNCRLYSALNMLSTVFSERKKNQVQDNTIQLPFHTDIWHLCDISSEPTISIINFNQSWAPGVKDLNHQGAYLSPTRGLWAITAFVRLESQGVLQSNLTDATLYYSTWVYFIVRTRVCSYRQVVSMDRPPGNQSSRCGIEMKVFGFEWTLRYEPLKLLETRTLTFATSVSVSV